MYYDSSDNDDKYKLIDFCFVKCCEITSVLNFKLLKSGCAILQNYSILIIKDIFKFLVNKTIIKA